MMYFFVHDLGHTLDNILSIDAMDSVLGDV